MRKKTLAITLAAVCAWMMTGCAQTNNTATDTSANVQEAQAPESPTAQDEGQAEKKSSDETAGGKDSYVIEMVGNSLRCSSAILMWTGQERLRMNWGMLP